MKFDKNVLIVVVALAAAGLFASTLPPARPSKPNRPVLTFLARAAKVGLWFLLVKTPPPHTENVCATGGDHDHSHLRQIDQHGQVVLNNGAGW
jgi:hypothetical protein